MRVDERNRISTKIVDLRVAASQDHPHSTRGIVDALCTVAELLLVVIGQLEDQKRKR